MMESHDQAGGRSSASHRKGTTKRRDQTAGGYQPGARLLLLTSEHPA